LNDSWCVFGHTLAQWADALRAHRGAIALSRRLLTPSIPKTGRRLLTAPDSVVRSVAPTRSGLRA
jgi:hypothetical protein